MILLPQYNKKYIAVFGLGKTGLSVVSSLLASGSSVFAWDEDLNTLEHAKKLYPMCFYLDPHYYKWHIISTLVLSPGIPNYCSPKQHWIVTMAKKYQCPISSDIEIFYHSQKSNSQKPKFICVTGTNGKSTTSALIYHILNLAKCNVAIGGNFGYPVLQLAPKKDLYILELSSYQISLLKNFIADVAILLNITPDHLDFHGNMENYIAVKKKIIKNSTLAIIGCNNKITEKIYQNFSGNKISISSIKKFNKGIYFSDKHLLFQGKKIDIRKMSINTECNFENIAASYLVAQYFNIKEEIIIQGLKSFSGLEHRNEYLGKIGNIIFINDSKATNAESTEKILPSYKNIYWIVGGRSKDRGIEILSKYCVNIKQAFLIGESTDEFANFFKKQNLHFEKCYTLDTATNLAYHNAKKSQDEAVILLSPSCSSLDQWQNFEKRGQAFKKLFLNLHSS